MPSAPRACASPACRASHALAPPLPRTPQVYAAQWFLSLGFLTIWPLLLEYSGGFGIEMALSELGTQLACGKIFYSLFLERTRVYYFSRGLSTGDATYIATGRSYSNMTVSFTALFRLYAR